MGPIPGPFETSYPFLDAFQAVLSMKGQDPSAFSHITSSSGPRVSHKLTHSFPLHDARAILINTIIQGWHSDPGRIRERHTAQREEKKIARIDDSLRVSCQGLHGERVRVAIGNKEAEHPSSSLRRVAVVWDIALSPATAFHWAPRGTWSTGAQRLCFLPSPQNSSQKGTGSVLEDPWKHQGLWSSPRAFCLCFMPRLPGRLGGAAVSSGLHRPCPLPASSAFTDTGQVLLAPPQRTNWPPLPVLFAQHGVATHCSSEIFVFIASLKQNKTKKLAIEQSMEISGLFFPQRCSHTALPKHSCSLLGWALMLLPLSLPLPAQKLESLGHHAGPAFFLPLVCSALLCEPSGPQKSGWPAPALPFPSSSPLFRQEPPCTDLAWEAQTWGEIQADFSASKRWRWEPIL